MLGGQPSRRTHRYVPVPRPQRVRARALQDRRIVDHHLVAYHLAVDRYGIPWVARYRARNARDEPGDLKARRVIKA